MSGRGRDALQDVWEWSGVSRGFAGVVRRPPGCLGVVGRSSRIYESGRDAPLDVREWLRGPRGFVGVVESPTRMSESGRESFPNV